MQKSVFIILVLSLAMAITACGKKQESLEEMQEPMSIDDLSSMNVALPQEMETKMQPAPAASPTLPPAMPQGPYKPSNQEIQAALKNAGYYMGEIDGKIGPQSKKAIKDFQAANGLEADGKVGSKTWAALNAYLNPAPPLRPRKKDKVSS